MDGQPGRAWHCSYMNLTGHSFGDKVILVRTESPYIRLEIESPGILALSPKSRHQQAKKAIEDALTDLQGATAFLIGGGS